MTKSDPLISIITVVLNGAKTIEQTIQSVLGQSYPNKEYIVIDGGSTDGTVDIIRRYKDQIKIWISEPDKGIFDAMNKGISLATGELIGIINADDWYEKDIFHTIADCYKKFGNKTVVHGLLRNFAEDQFYSIKGNSIRVLKYDMIQHPTCFIPRVIYQEYGSYDPRYKYSADFDLVLKYVNLGIEFKFLEKVIANFRIGGISSEGKSQSERFHILRKHKMISQSEAMMRLLLLYCSRWGKKVIGLRRH